MSPRETRQVVLMMAMQPFLLIGLNLALTTPSHDQSVYRWYVSLGTVGSYTSGMLAAYIGRQLSHPWKRLVCTLTIYGLFFTVLTLVKYWAASPQLLGGGFAGEYGIGAGLGLLFRRRHQQDGSTT